MRRETSDDDDDDDDDGDESRLFVFSFLCRPQSRRLRLLLLFVEDSLPLSAKKQQNTHKKTCIFFI